MNIPKEILYEISLYLDYVDKHSFKQAVGNVHTDNQWKLYEAEFDKQVRDSNMDFFQFMAGNILLNYTVPYLRNDPPGLRISFNLYPTTYMRFDPNTYVMVDPHNTEYIPTASPAV